MPEKETDNILEALRRHSLDDARMAAAMPDPVPRELQGQTFIDPDLPCEGPFTVTPATATGDLFGEDGGPATVLGPFQPDEFVTDPTSHVATAHTADGHPVILRVVDQWWQHNGLFLQALAEDGSPEHYLVQELRDNTLDIDL